MQQFVTCPVCFEPKKQITIQHLRSHNIMSFSEFHNLYPAAQNASEACRYAGTENGRQGRNTTIKAISTIR